jgi:hypothetical protein
MTADPHLLRPDHRPTPFTADEIRLGCQPGRTIRMLVIQPGEEPVVRVTRFASGDAEGAEQEHWQETPDGARLTETERRRSTWLGFQGHASFPADTTEIDEETIDIPAGRFECLRYTTERAAPSGRSGSRGRRPACRCGSRSGRTGASSTRPRRSRTCRAAAPDQDRARPRRPDRDRLIATA